MIAGTLTVLWTLAQLTPNPAKDPAIATANQSWFPWFLLAFLFVFAATGIGNGSTYRMIPLIWQTQARAATAENTPERRQAVVQATRESSAVIGIAGAIGALGGFLIPVTFGAPWVESPVDAVRSALAVFATFYAVCVAVTWFFYLRTSFATQRVPSLAGARI